MGHKQDAANRATRIPRRRVAAMAFFLSICGLIQAAAAMAPQTSRSDPTGPSPLDRGGSAPGYCSSSGGSTQYEGISDVLFTMNPDGSTATLTVKVFIANPTGCTAGNPCPEYDDFPEAVNAWIDWNGDQVWQASERVMDQEGSGYLNINYQGTMTFVSQVTIPAGATRPTWLRANLGWSFDPNDPCTPSWTWGNVFDKEVLEVLQVVRLDAGDDVPIDGVTDPVWQKQYDADCKLVDVSPAQDDSIADDMTSGKFKITATLAGCPGNPGYMPKVKYDWAVNLSGGSSGGTMGSGEFTGFSGDIEITTPQQVNDATLQLNFDILDGDEKLVAKQNITRRLYIILDTPNAAVRPPKEVWLQRATAWASGSKNADECRSNLVPGIYNNAGWTYVDVASSWNSLVEGGATQGNCVSFSNVWNGLTKVLGVPGTGVRQTRGTNSRGFITNPATSMDGNMGNAHAAGAAVDRWHFGMHQVGTGGGSFYDPTMGGIYGTLTGFIAWHATTGFFTEAGPPARLRQNLTGGHHVYFVNGNAPWGDFEYHSPVFGEPEPTGASGSFTGNLGVIAVDDNADGRYDRLAVSAEVNTSVGFDLTVAASLEAGGVYITNRPHVDAMLPSLYVIEVGGGLETAGLDLSGHDIGAAGLDGPYTVNLYLFDAAGMILDETTILSAAYSAAEFGERPATIIATTDAGQDINANTLYDFLVVSAEVEAFEAGDYSVSGRLLSGGTEVAGGEGSATLPVGVGSIGVVFDGRRINGSGLDGPYALELTLSDADGNPLEEAGPVTSAYTHTEFEPANVRFAAGLTDYGVDAGTNGLFDSLIVEASVDVVVAGDYEVLAWLHDAGGEEVVWTQANASLAVGSQTVLLPFDGLEIHDRGLDGPYNLAYFLVNGDDGSFVSATRDAYATAAYAYTAFEASAPPLVQATGNFADLGTDVNSNGLFDFLTINVEVQPSQAGNVVATGRLVNGLGQQIEWANNFVNLAADEIGTVQLNFSGRRIYATLLSGQFQLENLLVYHTGDPEASVYILNAHTTGAYDFADFERFADANDDGDIDLGDFAVFQRCFQTFPLGVDCAVMDVDSNATVDLLDYEVFEPALGGPN